MELLPDRKSWHSFHPGGIETRRCKKWPGSLRSSGGLSVITKKIVMPLMTAEELEFLLSRWSSIYLLILMM